MSGFNILKVYPELLDIVGLSERDRQHDLLAIFKRDIEDNFDFCVPLLAYLSDKSTRRS